MTVCDKENWATQEIVTVFECLGGNLDYKIELTNAGHQNGDYAWSGGVNPDKFKPSNPITCSTDLIGISTVWNNVVPYCCTISS